MGVEERIRDIIVGQLHPDEERITRQARFVDDLGAEPQDMITIISQFEKEFGIAMLTEEVRKMETVGQAIEYIESHAQR
jgi:acyl carrier protein